MIKILIFLIVLLPVIPLKAQLWVYPFSADSASVADELLNPGFMIRNVRFRGNPLAIGRFGSDLNAIPFKRGLLFSTGIAAHAASPNYSASMSYNMGTAGDRELSFLAGMNTQDAVVLEFDFMAYSDSICFDYFFASEEYPEYVNKGVNDVFAFFITNLETGIRNNLAMINGRSVSVDNINANVNSRFFKANRNWNFENMQYLSHYPDESGLAENVEYDGITASLTAATAIKPFEWYRLKIALADAGDAEYDTGVFIRSRSFRNVGRIPDQALDMSIKAYIGHLENFSTDIENNQLVVRANIEYQSDSFLVEKSFEGYLDLLAEVMRLNNSFNIEISGHTDNTGSQDYNLKLSARRAEMVAEYLIHKGVPENRLVYKGYGQSRPLLPNDIPENRTKNRRVEFRFRK